MKQPTQASYAGWVISTVVLLSLLSFAAAVDASGCAAPGTFAFTIGEGAGTLVLSADGKASLILLPGHFFCETCSMGTRTLIGTYRTGDIGGGQCGFNLDLIEPEGRKVSIIGMVAFGGSVLLFQAATVPSFGPGIALRTDTLTGQ